MKFLITEKDKESRNTLENAVKATDNSAQIVTVDSVYTLFAQLGKNKDFDWILLDFALFGPDWRRHIKHLCEEKGDADYFFFSNIADREIFSFLFSQGCRGCIPRNFGQDAVFAAVSLIVKGYGYVPPSIMQAPPRTLPACAARSYRLPDGKTLTPRQVEVLGFLSKGLSNKQIAYEMSVSEATVKLHMNALLKNLDVNNRTQAVLSAQKFGFI